MNVRSLLPWDCDDRVAPTRDMPDIIMVCDNDPYAYERNLPLRYKVISDLFKLNFTLLIEFPSLLNQLAHV